MNHFLLPHTDLLNLLRPHNQKGARKAAGGYLGHRKIKGAIEFLRPCHIIDAAGIIIIKKNQISVNVKTAVLVGKGSFKYLAAVRTIHMKAIWIRSLGVVCNHSGILIRIADAADIFI